MLEYKVTKEGSKNIYNFNGEMTNDYLEELKNICAQAFVHHEPEYSLILDLKGVKKIDIQCVKMICRAHRISKKMDDSLQILGLKDEMIAPTVKTVDLKSFTTCDDYGIEDCIWHSRCHEIAGHDDAAVSKSVEQILDYVDSLKTRVEAIDKKISEEKKGQLSSIKQSTDVLQNQVEEFYKGLKLISAH